MKDNKKVPIILTAQREERIRKVVEHRRQDVVVVLEDIHDPHNAGAILRTCDALGIYKIHYVFEKQESFNPKKVGKSSSSTANKWMDIEKWTSTKECLSSLKEQGYRVIVSRLEEKAKDFTQMTFDKGEKIALVMGNENSGVSDTAIKMADTVFYFPMKGFIESFNVSVATALFLYEIIRQKGETIAESSKIKSLFEDYARR